MAENALPLASHHVENFTTALKRMHPAVGKAVCVMWQCLDSQIELDQFAESGGMPVLHIVKHGGAGTASVLPLGVVQLPELICSLLPENDRTTEIDWLVSAHAAFNVVQKIWVSRSALDEVRRHPVKIRRGFVGRGATSLVRAQLDGIQRHRFVEGPAPCSSRCTRPLRGANAAKESVDDLELVNAIVKTQSMPRNLDAKPKTEGEWAAFVKM